MTKFRQRLNYLYPKPPRQTKGAILWRKINSYKLVRDIWDLVDDVQTKALGMYAGHSAYFLVVSAIPMLMLISYVFSFFSFSSYDQVAEFVMDFSPEPLHGILTIFLREAYEHANAGWVSVSTLAVLWASSRSVYSLRLGLNKAMGVPARSYFYNRLIALPYTLIVAALMLIISMFLIFGNQIQQAIEQLLPELGMLTRYLIGRDTLSSLAIQFIFIWAVYTFLPDKRQHFLKTLPGTVFTCVCCWVFSFFFIINHLFFSPDATMFGRLGAALLALVWMYMCLFLFLIGGAFNHWFWERNIIRQVKDLIRLRGDTKLNLK